MSKIAWLTDIHLNFLKYDARKKFYLDVSETYADLILITGDIGEAKDVCGLLTEMSININKPIYFVLGNHDYYHGSVSGVRGDILNLCAQNNNLHWLGKPEIVVLDNQTILVGHDGWADGRYGDYDHSTINLNDSRLIAELFQVQLLGKSMLQKEMQKFADADATILGETLHQAAKAHPKRIIVATHVPPFPECSWHKDKPSDENWLPFFASKVTGDVISEIVQQYPAIQFLVLCGHTHTAKTINPVGNLEVRAGCAQYYQPAVQRVIDLS